MVRTTETVVDILRRHGPGALPLSWLTNELRRRRPAMRLGRNELRRLVERAGDRILLLEVVPDVLDLPDASDAPARVRAMEPLDSWVVLTSPSDAPDRCRLTHLLWRSLSALAQEVDPAARVGASRWVLQAHRTLRVWERLAGEESFPERRLGSDGKRNSP